MPSLINRVLEGRKIQHRRPWPRAVVGAHLWRFVTNELAQGRLSLLGLWGERATVHMAIMDEAAAEIAIISGSVWIVSALLALRSHVRLRAQ